MLSAVLLQGPAFNEQVASLQAELKLLKAANSQLTEDHKVRQQAYCRQSWQLLRLLCRCCCHAPLLFIS